MPTDYHIAWWNVENLFDVQSSPRREQWLQDKLDKELTGWTASVLNRKLRQLASIISQLNGGAGPDLLGVCEVENEHVLNRLVAALSGLGRNYQIAHKDAGDKRGIDVAFIYDANLLTVDATKLFTHRVQLRTGTRAILQATFTTQAGNDLVVLGNHWPSRMAGTYESEPYRIVAAETMAYFHERVRHYLGSDDVPVLAMGDFNDDPYSRSIMDYALAGRSRLKVMNSRTPRLLNLMWSIMDQGIGTHYYNNFPAVLDQMMASKGLVSEAGPLVVQAQTLRIERLPEMRSGSYEAPRRFGRPSSASTYDQDGFSDHFPVSVVVREL